MGLRELNRGFPDAPRELGSGPFLFLRFLRPNWNCSDAFGVFVCSVSFRGGQTDRISCSALSFHRLVSQYKIPLLQRAFSRALTCPDFCFFRAKKDSRIVAHIPTPLAHFLKSGGNAKLLQRETGASFCVRRCSPSVRHIAVTLPVTVSFPNGHSSHERLTQFSANLSALREVLPSDTRPLPLSLPRFPWRKTQTQNP